MIKISGLTKIYKSRKKEQCVALDNISFSLADKGFVFIANTIGEDIVDLGIGLASAKVVEGAAKGCGGILDAHAVLGKDLDLGRIGQCVEVARHDELLGAVGNVLDHL